MKEIFMIILKNKFFWGLILILFLINGVVSANKDYNEDLLHEYYSFEAQDTSFLQEVMEPVLSKRDSLTLFAESLLGKNYVYGKTGPDNFDCSGYIYYVFKRFNINLSRSSKYQARDGNKINRDEVKKGDLLFFKSPSPNNPNIGHVGIALGNEDGKIKFIHSSTGRGVVIDSLESKHYGRRFMEARRVISTDN